MRCAAGIVVAGGSGRRMKGPVAKQYLTLGGIPVLARTLEAVSRAVEIDAVFLVVPAGDETYCRDRILGCCRHLKPVSLVIGGGERQQSVCNGLKAAKQGGFRIAVIHDGVRPFVDPKRIDATIRNADITGACMLALPAIDTLKQVDETGAVSGTLSRENIWLAQTPQTFLLDDILAAHETAEKDGIVGTDDAFLLERLGHPVRVLRGSRFNIKITTPEDLLLAEAILAATVLGSDS